MPEPLWDQCLRRLEQDLTDRDINTWLRPLEPQLDGHRLQLAAPNAVVLRRVRDDFLQLINRALHQLMPDDAPLVEVTIRSDEPTPADVSVSAGSTSGRTSA